MSRFYPIIILLLAALCCFLLLFNREINLEAELAKREAEGIKKELKAKDSLIAVSDKREKALEATSFALQARYDSAVKSSTLGWKLYSNEKKQRRTPILADSVYTSVIDSLFRQ